MYHCTVREHPLENYTKVGDVIYLIKDSVPLPVVVKVSPKRKFGEFYYEVNLNGKWVKGTLRHKDINITWKPM